MAAFKRERVVLRHKANHGHAAFALDGALSVAVRALAHAGKHHRGDARILAKAADALDGRRQR